jgi:hypothetical protein
MAEAKLEHRGDNDDKRQAATKLEKRQANSLGSKQEVGVNEKSSVEEDEQRLQVCRVWNMAAVNVTKSSTGKAYSAA